MSDRESGEALGAADALRLCMQAHPALRAVVTRFAGESVATAARRTVEASTRPSDLALQALREVIDERCFLPPGEADALIAQIARRPVLNTADHMGFITHPLLVQGNLVMGLGLRMLDEHFIPVLAGERVPIDNETVGGGIALASGNIPLFSERSRRFCMFGTLPFTEVALAEARRGAVVRNLRMEEREGASRILDLVERQPGIRSASCFSEQILRTNKSLWTAMLRGWPKFPALIYIPLEALAIRMLSLAHRWSIAHPATRLIEEPELYRRWSRAVLSTEQPVTGSGWVDGRGTSLFWGLTAARNGLPVPLAHDGAVLVAAPGTAHAFEPVPLRLDAVVARLIRGDLIPSLALCFTLFLSDGLTCCGGFNQIRYLDGLRAGWMEVSDPQDAARWEASRTDGFCVGPHFVFRDDGKLPSAADFITDPEKYGARALQAGAQTTWDEACAQGARLWWKYLEPAIRRSVERAGGDPDAVVAKLRAITP